MKYIASRISDGNHLFPAEINLEDSGLTVKIPGFFRNQSKYFDFKEIASVEVNSPLMGYSTITFYAGGTSMVAHGFSSSEVKKIKRAIEQGKKSNNISNSRDANDRRNNSYNYSGVYKIHEDIEFKNQMSVLAANAKNKFNKYKELLIEAMVDAAFIDEKTPAEIDEIEIKGTNARDYLAEQVRKWYSNYQEVIDNIINECALKADKQIAKIMQDRSKDTALFDAEEVEEDFGSKLHLQVKFIKIIKNYDDLAIEILEDQENIDNHKRLINRFARRILNNEGMQLIRESLEDDVEQDDYTLELLNLLNIIEKCYSVLNQIKAESEKKRFRFGLNFIGVSEFLTSQENEPKDKISKIIDCVDNLVQRFAKFVEES